MHPSVEITDFSADRILLAFDKYSGNTNSRNTNEKNDEDEEPGLFLIHYNYNAHRLCTTNNKS